MKDLRHILLPDVRNDLVLVCRSSSRLEAIFKSKTMADRCFDFPAWTDC